TPSGAFQRAISHHEEDSALIPAASQQTRKCEVEDTLSERAYGMRPNACMAPLSGTVNCSCEDRQELAQVRCLRESLRSIRAPERCSFPSPVNGGFRDGAGLVRRPSSDTFDQNKQNSLAINVQAPLVGAELPTVVIRIRSALAEVLRPPNKNLSPAC